MLEGKKFHHLWEDNKFMPMYQIIKRREPIFEKSSFPRIQNGSEENVPPFFSCVVSVINCFP
jgi:hypothetical protein